MNRHARLPAVPALAPERHVVYVGEFTVCIVVIKNLVCLCFTLWVRRRVAAETQ